MSVHDDDILDFDFVEDAAQESTPATPRGPEPPRPPAQPGGGGPRGPQRPSFRAPHGLMPLLRLAALIVFAIALVVLLVVWTEGCAGKSTEDEIADYYSTIGAVGADSAKIGVDLSTLLTTPGLAQDELETKLAGLVQQQQLDVQRANDIDPPGSLARPYERALEALVMRVSGLQGMLATFKATKDSDDAAAAGELLTAQGRRLEASDVIWKDLFQDASNAAAADEGVTTLKAPPSVFVENPALYSASSMSAIWQRIHGASTGGTPSGVHGSQLAFTNVLPAGTQLSTQTETTIVVSTDLGFEVGVLNSGENQEVQVEVTLTIPADPDPIVKKATIDLIDPGETKSVKFTDFPDVPFGEDTSVQVSVKPVPGETNTSNNSAEYPVVFSLTP